MGFFKKLLLFAVFVIHKMPHAVHRTMAWMVALIWFDLLRIRRKVAIGNILKAFPEKSPDEACRLARQSLYHMGLTLTEFFSLPFLGRKEFREMVKVKGEDHLRQALRENKGVLVLGVHISNGDLAIAALASWGYPIHVISKIFKNKWLNEIWFSSRRAKGVGFIPPRKSSYRILKALKRNELVVFPLDQYTGPPNGILT